MSGTIGHLLMKIMIKLPICAIYQCKISNMGTGKNFIGIFFDFFYGDVAKYGPTAYLCTRVDENMIIKVNKLSESCQ